MLINRRPAGWRDPDVVKSLLWLAGLLTVLVIPAIYRVLRPAD